MTDVPPILVGETKDMNRDLPYRPEAVVREGYGVREFAVGAVVTLNSGGPDMTVEAVKINYHDTIDDSLSSDTAVSVTWIAMGRQQRATFDQRMLTTRVPRPKKKATGCGCGAPSCDRCHP